MKYITFKNKSQMKTKNVLIVAAITISGVLNLNSAFAEDQGNVVTLNIKLNPIQTITVNADQKNVDIVYATEDNYKKGVSVEKDNHIEVFSTGGFQVKVNSATRLTNDKGAWIDASDVRVLATPGSTNGGKNTIESAVALGSEQTLIASTTGGRGLNYKVIYDNTLAGDNDKYLNLYNKDADNIFTATVTYTIVAN